MPTNKILAAEFASTFSEDALSQIAKASRHYAERLNDNKYEHVFLMLAVACENILALAKSKRDT